MICEENDIVCAQAVLCAHEGSLLFHNNDPKKKAAAVSASNKGKGEKTKKPTTTRTSDDLEADIGSHLILVHYPNLPFFLQDLDPYSTVIILETMRPTYQNNVQVIPVGLVCIRDRTLGRSVLEKGFFSDQMIEDGSVSVKWFNKLQVMRIIDDLNKKALEYVTDSDVYFDTVMQVVSTPTGPNAVHYPFIGDLTPHVNALFLKSLLGTWIRMFENDLKKELVLPDSDLRPLTYLERLSLFLHVSLRRNKTKDVDTLIRIHLLSAIRTEEAYPEDGEDSIDRAEEEEDEEEIPMDQGDNKEGNQLCDVNRGMYHYKKSFCDQIQQYNRLVKAFQENIQLTSTRLTDAMTAKRSRYKAFPLYVSLEMDKISSKQIETIPVNCADTKSMSVWTDTMANELHAAINDKTVYEDCIGQVQPIYECQVNSPDFVLKLYGNYTPYTESLTAQGWPVIPRVYFKLKYCQTLQYEEGGIQNILTNAHHFFTPIFWSSDRKTFMRVVAVEEKTIRANRDDDEDQDEEGKGHELAAKRARLDIAHKTATKHSLEDLLKSSWDITKNDMHANEYLTDALHWSSFVADIDLYTHIPTSVEDTAKNACELVSSIINTCIGSPPHKIAVFSSSKEPSSIADNNGSNQIMKIGLHVHARLPTGTVLTAQACLQIADMCEMKRFSYPDTLGQQGESIDNTKTVFDRNIYTQQFAKDNKFGGHCLRCPYQSKNHTDKDRTLQLVHSEGDPFSVMDLFVHAPQFYPDTGERCLYGKVIVGFSGVSDRRDVQFFQKHVEISVEKHIEKACKTKVKDMLAEINKKSVLFHGPPEEDRHLLTQIVQECWTDNGKKALFAYMTSVRGRNDKAFSDDEKTSISGAEVAYNEKTDELMLSVRGSFLIPYCCRLPHNNAKNGSTKTTLKLGISSKMLGLCIFSNKCYKTSCVQLSYIPSCSIAVQNVFLSPYLLKKMDRFLSTYFNTSTTRIWSIEAKTTKSDCAMLLEGIDFNDDMLYEDDDEMMEESTEEEAKKNGTNDDDQPRTTNYTAISLLHHGTGLKSLLGESIQCSIRKILFFNPKMDKVSLCVELYSGSFVLCLSNAKVLTGHSLDNVVGAAQEWRMLDRELVVRLQNMNK